MYGARRTSRTPASSPRSRRGCVARLMSLVPTPRMRIKLKNSSTGMSTGYPPMSASGPEQANDDPTTTGRAGFDRRSTSTGASGHSKVAKRHGASAAAALGNAHTSAPVSPRRPTGRPDAIAAQRVQRDAEEQPSRAVACTDAKRLSAIPRRPLCDRSRSGQAGLGDRLATEVPGHRRPKLGPLTPKTNRSKRALGHVLESVRRNRLATSYEETIYGFVGIAAPIF